MRLSVSDLSCSRGGMPVLEGVSFEVPSGAALALRGPNGSGKTTLLRTIAGLQPPLAGEVSVPREEVAYAAHADGVKATLSVAENLRFWARINGVADIAPALGAFALEDLADRPARNLSAGQRRRLGLARLLVSDRPVWALDEPTVSLDAEAVGWFAEAVRNHLAGGGVALIATHIDLGLAAEALEVARFQAAPAPLGGFDEAFL